ncbi:MAG TPA: hypothetical protein VK528_03405 [Flavobacterium sp.]|nr:hypothetical protein [Flavobacterium sp.]
MKTVTQFIIGMLLFSFNYTQAQVELDAVDVSSNYKYEEVRYYYYPNLQAYFDTKVGLYLYQQNGEWIESEKLSPTFRGYSLKNGAYVMIKDYTGDEPYTLLEQHKAKYPADYSSRPKRDVASSD